MTPDAFAIGGLDAALLARPVDAPSTRAQTADDAEKAARDFEAFFLTQTFEALQEGLSTAPPFGGGSGEKAWRSFLSQEYAQAVVNAGGVGLADRLASEIIALQTEG